MCIITCPYWKQGLALTRVDRETLTLYFLCSNVVNATELFEETRPGFWQAIKIDIDSLKNGCIEHIRTFYDHIKGFCACFLMAVGKRVHLS